MKYFFNSRTSVALAPNTCRFMIQELSERRERRGGDDGTTTEDDERRATLKSRRKGKMSRGKLNEERRRRRRARENQEIDLEGQTEMGSNAEGGRMRRDGRRRCMRKNFTREPANPRERFASSARLPAVSVSCAIPYAALVRSNDCARTRPDRSTLALFEPGIARISACSLAMIESSYRSPDGKPRVR